jgi:hypothetical protein
MQQNGCCRRRRRRRRRRRKWLYRTKMKIARSNELLKNGKPKKET